jgi:hypothetical protein
MLYCLKQLINTIREDKADYAQLGKRLSAYTGYAVVLPNYRLTSKNTASPNYMLKHPAHAEDLLQFLEFIRTWPGPEGHDRTTPLYDSERIYIATHSCSTHMLLSILFDTTTISPSLTPSPALARAIKGVGMSEGLHDIDALIRAFPGHKAWVFDDPFGDRTSYADVSPYLWPKRTGELNTDHVYWLVIHSPGDSLVNEEQSATMYAHLNELFDSNQVEKSFDELKEDHNDILHTEKYVKIVGAWIKRREGQ